MNGQDELMEMVRSIFREVSEKPLGEIAPETPIAELGIDSVSLAEIVGRIEDTLDIEVPASQWLQVRTLQQVIDMIMQASQK